MLTKRKRDQGESIHMRDLFNPLRLIFWYYTLPMMGVVFVFIRFLEVML